ncbi:hypothetical protein IC582_003998 [Cucumis melo]|uniref:Uncharacterized protein LOC103502747 n=2 Tax=Cucumis melo TaxID=3656 RepID=A0A1S4E4Y4_CUCME|nr:uncharacterized protein LOC103502747 [Cucumis melo]KAA0046733.1 uncharacterized protein E6C27_scaffold216G00140 [Cucumis melo var. makuwa]TYK14510.1 uncharacterized protein E5676_scaffold15G00250 [Cucumis melo var. makuwa]
MATNLLTFTPAGIRACAASADRRSDLNRRKASSSTNWWAPVFGWSSEPDYIDSAANKAEPQNLAGAASKPDLETKSVRGRFSPGCFTEAKARQLRMMTTETESFHDVMYHSAIASRLASDFKSRGDS